jgi:hypothetical protein
MNLREQVERWQRQPERIRRGCVLKMAGRLGLGQRRVALWMAHEAPRWKSGAQWVYPRDATIAHLLDMAGLLAQAGMSVLGGAGISEGVPGSKSK